MNCHRLDVTKETGQVNTMLDPEFVDQKKDMSVAVGKIQIRSVEKLIVLYCC